jgi:hypothetical protein
MLEIHHNDIEPLPALRSPKLGYQRNHHQRCERIMSQGILSFKYEEEKNKRHDGVGRVAYIPGFSRSDEYRRVVYSFFSLISMGSRISYGLMSESSTRSVAAPFRNEKSKRGFDHSLPSFS